MATIKQRLAVREVLKGSSLTNAMKIAKYSPKTVKNTGKLTRAKGFKEELANYGLTEELVKTALVEDIENKPQRRVMELNLAADILHLKKNDSPMQIEKAVIQIQMIAPSETKEIKNEQQSDESRTHI